jgi:hypothetical protein
MIRQLDATMQSAPQDNQLMSKHRVLRLEPQLRLERRAQGAQYRRSIGRIAAEPAAKNDNS